MSAPNTPPVPGPKDLDRYQKYQNVVRAPSAAAQERVKAAEHMRKLEARFPTIRDIVDRENRAKKTYDEVRKQKFGNAPKAKDVRPPPTEGGSLADRARRAVIRGLGRDPAVWLAEQIDRAVEVTARELAEAGEDYIKTWDQGYIMLGIADEIENGTDVVFNDAEDEESGEALIEITFTVSNALWAKIVGDPDGARALVEFLERENQSAAPE